MLSAISASAASSSRWRGSPRCLVPTSSSRRLCGCGSRVMCRGGIGHIALWVYLLIAFVVLPVFVPLAVIAAEPARRRKQVMAPFALIGAVIAVTLLAAMVRGPVGVKLAPYHLSYGIRLPAGLVIIALYVVAVCGPLLMSGYRNVVLFGVVNLIAVVIIARLTISGFASVWCGWAAVSSAAITLHCRFVGPRPQAPGPGLTDSYPPADQHRDEAGDRADGLGEVGDGPIRQHGDCHLCAGPVAEANPPQAAQWALLTARP